MINVNDEKKKKDEEKKLTFKEQIKRTIFNRFYLDFIAYLIILVLGLMLNAGLFVSNAKDDVGTKIGLGLLIFIVLGVMFFVLGYLSARRRKGSNKYKASFGIYMILFAIYILATVFYKEGVSNFALIEFLEKVKDMMVTMHSYIFNWLNLLCDKEIAGEVYALIPPFIIFLGSRTNRVVAIKRKQRKMERMNEDGERNI